MTLACSALVIPALLVDAQDARIADYTAFKAGSAALEAQNWEEAVEQLLRVPAHKPVSPLTPRAVLLAASALIELNKPGDAQALIRRYLTTLPSATAYATLAAASEKAGDRTGAVQNWQRVYYTYPRATEAADAEAALTRLEAPPASPQLAVARAYRLLDSGDTGRARREIGAVLPRLTGPERDVARVRGCPSAACLLQLELSSAAADAERLYQLVGFAHRVDSDADVMKHANALSRYPKSSWRLKGIVAAGNHFLLKNDAEHAKPFYRACQADFATDAQAAYCHWKMIWYAHMRRNPDAPRLMREHLDRFPKSANSGAALYFLGAHAELATRFPNSYYTTLVRDKPAVRGRGALDWNANEVTLIRVERARLLGTAGEPDFADGELRFGAKNDTGAQAHVLALEAANIAGSEAGAYRGLRTIKALVPDYLLWSFDAAPERFWRAAFPMPWREAVEANSRERGLDPFVVAALIRQESEWNPTVVSSARAYGLMQVLPSTGRQLGASPASRLFEPEVNLRAGTRHLKSMLDSFDGQWEPTLAAYNAGKTRAVAWLGWGEFREPAEFIETIPFSETRAYVQIVLRNADIYRRLYGRNDASAN
jgi:soluble lytic murein transglycosylase